MTNNKKEFVLTIEANLVLKGLIRNDKIVDSCSVGFLFVKGDDGNFDGIAEFALAPMKGQARSVVIKKTEDDDVAEVTLYFSPHIEDDTILYVGWGEGTG